LKGLYFWNERSAESLKTSIGYFQEAIRKDPSYALAYSGLADAYDVASDYALLSPRECYSNAKTAVLKALELDPTLAQAHATLADIKSAYEWDWSDAEAEFKRALELNPGYATAHYWELQKAVDLSGGDSSYLAALAHASALAGNQHKARVICARLQKRAATEYVSSYDIALVYLGLNQQKEALYWLNRAYGEDDPHMNFLSVDPTFDELRSDRQFQNLLQRISLS